MSKVVNNKKGEEDKIDKALKIIGIICVSVILIEGISLLFMYLKKEKNTIYYDVSNEIVNAGKGYITAGSSNFRYSKLNKKIDYQKATITVYDNDKVKQEIYYDSKYNSTFLSVVKVDDGYVAVGSTESSKTQNSKGLSDALIIKFDLKGKKIWKDSYGTLANSLFTRVIKVDDGFIAVGQSVYENTEVGNSVKGGGIIVKYDNDGKILWYNNYGGNKSGIFYDVVYANDGFYAVGKDSVDTGIIVKFNNDGELILNKNYSYTDNIGFSSIVNVDDYLLVAGSKKISGDNKEKDYNPVIVKYDYDGEMIWQKSYKNKGLDRWTDIYKTDNDIFVVGYNGIKDNENSKEGVTKYTYSGIIAKYNLDKDLLWSKEFNKKNNDYFTSIIVNDNKLLVCGYSNSKLKINRSNGKDYFTMFNEYNKNGKLVNTWGKEY